MAMPKRQSRAEHEPARQDTRGPFLAPVSTARVWAELRRASFAVVSHVTPDGAPRSSGVLYTAGEDRLFCVVAADSWKARHLARDGRIAVTVPVRRGGPLALVLPIPPAAISFHGTATVRRADAATIRTLPGRLERLLPEAGRDAASIVEITPQGRFLTYGIGVSLRRMRDPATARGRIPVR